MAGTLIGEIVNACDAVTGFSAGNISGDDDFAEGSGAVGAKVSNTYLEFYTTALGVTAPYDFSLAGAESGWHFIMWFSSKSKLSATSGYRLIFGNGTDRAEWDVPPVTSELKRNGAFVTRVIDPARDFSRITTGSWSTTGNPAQLSNITQIGGGIQTTVSIMGSFNNAQVDQMTIGLGIRLSGGTIGAPDSFETARAADEDAGIWGWSQSDVLKGGIYIGPETGSAASVFISESETRKFAASPVAAGFFRIEARGAGTDVTINGANLAAVDPSVARWDYTVGSTTNSWNDNDSVYSGLGTMTLESFATLKNIKITDINSIIHNGAVFEGINISAANTADGVALISTADPTNIKDVNFNFSDGHAIEITSPGTFTFTGNKFTGYGADGTNDAAIYNNSGGAVILNIAGGVSSPTVRNGAGASTTVNNDTNITLTGLPTAGSGVEVRIYDDVGTINNPIAGADIAGAENVTTGSFAFSDSANNDIIIVIFDTVNTKDGGVYIQYEVPASDTSLPFSLLSDRNYLNP